MNLQTPSVNATVRQRRVNVPGATSSVGAAVELNERKFALKTFMTLKKRKPAKAQGKCCMKNLAGVKRSLNVAPTAATDYCIGLYETPSLFCFPVLEVEMKINKLR